VRGHRRPVDDARLLRVIDACWADAVSRAGEWLACRPGCTPCCIGPFPVTSLDAKRLRRGWQELARRDAERAERVLERARRDVAALRSGFPGDPERGVLDDDESHLESFLARHPERACPVLDPESGRCDLYAHRPVVCRTFGPPTRIGGESLPPCRLCFRGASDEEIERCRVEPDAEGLEDRLVREDADTLIAFVFEPWTSGRAGTG